MAKNNRKVPAIAVSIEEPNDSLGNEIQVPDEYKFGLSSPSRQVRVSYGGQPFHLGVVDGIPIRHKGGNGGGNTTGTGQTRKTGKNSGSRYSNVPTVIRDPEIICEWREGPTENSGQFLLNQNNELIKKSYIRKVSPKTREGKFLNDLYWDMRQLAISIYKEHNEFSLATDRIHDDLLGKGYHDSVDVIMNRHIGVYLGTRLITDILVWVDGGFHDQMMSSDEDSETPGTA